MKLLVAIPHYFGRTGGEHGSLVARSQVRARAVSACLAGLHQALGVRQRVLQIDDRRAVLANQNVCHELQVVVCTTGEEHLLDQLAAPAELFARHATQAEPLLLGYECHAVLRDALGMFDYYGFMEDDLVLRDPWFLHKLADFTRLAGQSRLLQPNRYEVAPAGIIHKAYIDGDLAQRVTAQFRSDAGPAELTQQALGMPILFRRALNPHAGCFFLTAEQMAHWADRPYFLDRKADFVGPLESAATLGVLRAFEVFKPAMQNAAWLELQHFGAQFLRLAQPVPNPPGSAAN